MRPLLALAIVIGILGSVAAYMKFQAAHQVVAEAPQEKAAKASYNLEVTLTFDAAADAFALQDATSLLVTFRGYAILKKTEPVIAGESLKVEDVAGIVEGRNEFFLQATPSDTGGASQHAARVRILQAENVVAEQTMWSPAGEPVQGLLTLEVPATSTEAAHEHE